MVVDGTVIVGWDVHNEPKGGRPAGVVALDARTGRVRWRTVTAPGETAGRTPRAPGCGDVWGSPAVDRARGLVIVGTGNCVVADGWGRGERRAHGLRPRRRARALDLPTPSAEPGRPRLRGRAQPLRGRRPPARRTRQQGRAGTTSSIASPARRSRPSTPPRPGLTRPGGNFSTGGFIGPAAYADGMVVGGTAVGRAPYLHGIDVRTERIAWQNREPAATYAATAIAGDVAFVGGTDFTLRAVRVADGDRSLVASHEGRGLGRRGGRPRPASTQSPASVSPAPGSRSRTSGVYAFVLHGQGRSTSASRGHRPPRRTDDRRRRRGRSECVGAPCALAFTLRAPPAGLTPDRDARDHRSPVPAARDDERARRPGAMGPARQRGGRRGRDELRRLHVRVATTTRPVAWSACSTPTAACTGTSRSPCRAPPTTGSPSSRSRGATMPSLADGFDRLVTTPVLHAATRTSSLGGHHAPHRRHPARRSRRHRPAHRAARAGPRVIGRDVAADRVQRTGQQPRRVRVGATLPPPTRDHHPRRRPRPASTSTRRSASSRAGTTVRAGSSRARTRGSRTRLRAGGSSR